MRLVSLLIVLPLLLAGCEMAMGWKLEQAVLDALAKDQRVAMSTFDVSATDEGVVTITGEVDVPEKLDVVTEIAKAVPGVTSVINNCTYPELVTNPVMDDTVVPGIGGGML
jgi:hypothetical protein